MTLAPVRRPAPVAARLPEAPLPLRAASTLLALAVALPALLSAVPLDRWVLRLLPFGVLALLLLTPLRAQLRLRVPWTVLLLFVWCCASVLWSADPVQTQRRLVELAALVGTGLLAGQLLGLRGTQLAVARGAQLVLGAVAVSLVVLPGWSTAPGTDGAPGWHGVLSHKNSLGFFCVVAVVTFWLALPHGRVRLAWTGLAVVLLVGSQSSSALAVGVLAVGVLAWTRTRRQLLLPASRAAASSVLVLVLAALAAVTARSPDLVLGLLGRNSSLTGRTEIWVATWRQITESPWIGHGWGGLWSPTSPPTLALWREARFEAYYAHNGYLDVLAQIGVVGLLLFLALLGRVLLTTWRRRDDDVQLWASLLVVVLLVWSITESAPFTGEGLLLLLVLVGALEGPLRVRPAAARAAGPRSAARAAAPATSG